MTMADPKHVAVIDIGKTNAKVALVDLDALHEIAVRRRPNRVLAGPPYPHYDIDALWAFILESLKAFQAEHGIDAVTVTTHGASAALLDAEGDLACPVLDYEHDGPDGLTAEYDAVRPAFAETGSPRLPLGLNLGAQLFWQFEAFPEVRENTQSILTYPQYWGFRLSGVAANEVTSLGCHTDLWNPHEKRFSTLVEHMGWSGLMAPVKRAADCLGTVTREVAGATGLPPSTPVICGIHDSNASLYPHLLFRNAPFSVVSTGTWVICMAIGGRTVTLDPARDTLINVNARGASVPSARFMGGREFEILTDGAPQHVTPDDISAALEKAIMIFPAVERRSGPYQGRQHSWNTDPATLTAGERVAAISFYLALMTSVCLDIAGADGPTVVEGPFADNAAYRQMVAAATGRPVTASSGTGTSIGAAMLAAEDQPPPANIQGTQDKPRPDFQRYADAWRQAVDA